MIQESGTTAAAITSRAQPFARVRGWTESPVWSKVRRERWMYAFILPGFLFFVVFRYLPLLGNLVAFEDYSPYLGFVGSRFVGFDNFVALFTNPAVGNALLNTLIINGLQILFYFPATIGLALLLNSVLNTGVKRIIQSIVYLPYFIGWVVLVSVWASVLGGDGILNHTLSNAGLPTVNLMRNPAAFKPMMVLEYIWKNVGWGTIIFLAAISKIEPYLYEAAVVDGAGPWRRMWHVTLPGIRGIAVLLLILNLGSILTTGFEQILLQEPAVGAQAGDVLDTFVYFQGILAGNWGLSAAVGLSKGIVGTILVILANKLAHLLGEQGVF
jgi:putative aldouronate transport system permease protein